MTLYATLRACFKKSMLFLLLCRSFDTLTFGRGLAALGHVIEKTSFFSFVMSLFCTIFVVTNRPFRGWWVENLIGLRGWSTCARGWVRGRCRTLLLHTNLENLSKGRKRRGTSTWMIICPSPLWDEYVYLHHGVGWLVVYSFAGHFPEPVCGIDMDI